MIIVYLIIVCCHYPQFVDMNEQKADIFTRIYILTYLLSNTVKMLRTLKCVRKDGIKTR